MIRPATAPRLLSPGSGSAIGCLLCDHKTAIAVLYHKRLPRVRPASNRPALRERDQPSAQRG